MTVGFPACSSCGAPIYRAPGPRAVATPELCAACERRATPHITVDGDRLCCGRCFRSAVLGLPGMRDELVRERFVAEHRACPEGEQL